MYVLYLAYGLIKDYGTATNQMLSLAAIAIFVVGGGLIAYAVGLLLFVAAVAIWRLTLQAVRYCRSKIREGGVVYHETEY